MSAADPEIEIKTGPHDPPNSPELDAMLRLESKFDDILERASRFFAGFELRVESVEKRLEDAERRLAVLERASKCPIAHDTDPAPPP
jgi:hypothetical protein